MIIDDIKSIAKRIKFGLEGVLDSNIIASDTPWRKLNKNQVMPDLSESNLDQYKEIKEDKDDDFSSFRDSYLLGFYGGVLINAGIRLKIAYEVNANFQNPIATAASLFVPEVISGLTRLAELIPESIYVNKNYNRRQEVKSD